MFEYYITEGERGPLISSGVQSEIVIEGPLSTSMFIYAGKPGNNYYEKSSFYDTWSSDSLTWVKNSKEILLAELDLKSSISQKWENIKSIRNRLLQASDWTQLPDVPLVTKEAWAVYRQALRDVTDQPDPFNIVWPTPPN